MLYLYSAAVTTNSFYGPYSSKKLVSAKHCQSCYCFTAFCFFLCVSCFDTVVSASEEHSM